MKKFVIQVTALIIVIFAGLFFSFFNPNRPFVNQQSQISSENRQIIVGNSTINAELADTQIERQKGLGGRQALATNSGMLFIFESEQKHQFWMKGLNFPIDFIWIKDLMVVDIITNAQPPQPGQKDETLPLYVPNQPVDMVLEVNRGFVETHGIKVGDKVEIR